MRFGAYLYGDPRHTEAESRTLERHGFSRVWFGELPTMGFADPIQGMRDAAASTDALEVGTGVTAAGVRPVASLVTQLGTVNSVATGRVTLGFGTGAFARRLLGMSPMKIAAFRTELEQLRLLLDGGIADVDGQPVAFREPRGGVRLDPPVRVMVAAGGPKTAALAGEFGDGLLATGVYDAAELQTLRRRAEDAARTGGREPDALTFCLEAGPLCVVRDGEDLRSSRVLEIVEPVLSGYLVLWAVLGLEPEQAPPEAADLYARILADARSTHGEDPARLLFGMTDGCLLRRPENDRLLTPAVIEACTLIGHRSELRDRIADFGRAGVTDIAVFRGRSYRWSDGGDLGDLVDLMQAI